MARLAVCALSAVLWSGAAMAAAAAQTPRFGFSAESALVAIPVRVTGRGGDFVSGLKRDNFRVFEDGRPVTLSVFDDVNAPVTVGLLVDHSRSMAPNLAGVATAVRAFARSSNPEDEMFVVNFNSGIALAPESGFTSDPAALAAAVEGGEARGRTRLYDAIAAGLERLADGHCARRALIVISDGGDNFSQASWRDTVAAVRKSQAAIYSIALLSDDADQNPGALRTLAHDSGGNFHAPGSGAEVAADCSRIARDLRESYTLGFDPGGSRAGYHKLRVEVAAPGVSGVRVQFREGFYFDRGGS